VRELENCLARAVILSKGPLVQPQDLSVKPEADRVKSSPEETAKPDPDISRPGMKMKDMEKELIRRTLFTCAGNKSEAAKVLGISRKALYEKMEKFKING
jgi:DNA-binding NtrC family response regulator